MDEEEFSIFRRFSTLEQALELQDQLEAEGIQTIIADNVPPVDINFGGSTLNNEIEIRIAPDDFQKAEELLLQQAENLVDNVDPEHYLFDFSTEELYEVLIKYDEWSEFDYTLAAQLLEKRGEQVDEQTLTRLKKERINELARPEKGQKGWIIAGYIFAILGGFLGLIIGYALWKSKKTLPDGDKVPSYSENDQKHGQYIFLIGMIVLPISILSKAFLMP
ncbi:MAG: hypothetical protein AAF466_00295 [Bacteroidota bacterium]